MFNSKFSGLYITALILCSTHASMAKKFTYAVDQQWLYFMKTDPYDLGVLCRYHFEKDTTEEITLERLPDIEDPSYSVSSIAVYADRIAVSRHDHVFFYCIQGSFASFESSTQMPSWVEHIAFDSKGIPLVIMTSNRLRKKLIISKIRKDGHVRNLKRMKLDHAWCYNLHPNQYINTFNGSVYIMDGPDYDLKVWDKHWVDRIDLHEYFDSDNIQFHRELNRASRSTAQLAVAMDALDSLCFDYMEEVYPADDGVYIVYSPQGSGLEAGVKRHVKQITSEGIRTYAMTAYRYSVYQLGFVVYGNELRIIQHDALGIRIKTLSDLEEL